MRLLRILLILAGVVLLVLAFVPLPAEVFDMGGCAGVYYADDCIPANVMATGKWYDKTGAEVARPPLHIEWGIYWGMPEGGMGGKGKGDTFTTSYGLTNIPAWVYDNGAGYTEYYGQIRIYMPTSQWTILNAFHSAGSPYDYRVEWWMENFNGDISHSTNWKGGDSYQTDFIFCELDETGDCADISVPGGDTQPPPVHDPDKIDDAPPEEEAEAEQETEEGMRCNPIFAILGVVLILVGLLWRS